ncbi:MAG: MmgE/PrpD family protein [Thermodesulfobacteriota bacterium]|nr:MmgE/PrpD family protein [Thermodesulfobacteriota bacterium]
MNETRDLVNFITRLSFENLPENVRETAKLCLLDTVGVGIYGSQMEWSKIVAEYAKEYASVAESSVWGQGWKTSAPYAALINGTSAHGIEMDDRSATYDLHPGSAIVSAALAAWEKSGATGKDVIAAIVGGYEIAIRLGAALRGSCRVRFYGSPIKNLFGATVAAGKLFGLDNNTMLNAVGIAGSMASGLREWSSDPKGTMVKRLSGGGWPAQNGVMAALLASKGLTGPATILEGKRGICHAFGVNEGNVSWKEPQTGELTKDLGKDYWIMRREVKAYATCGGLQASVDCVNELKSKYKITPEQIEHVDIGCSFKVYDQHDSKHPQSIMAAQYSLPFVTALAFFEDLSDPAAWVDQVLTKPEVVGLVEKVDMAIDDDLQKIFQETNDYGGTKMTVRLKDGRECNAWVRYSKGTVGNPATSEDIHRKFTVLACHVFSRDRVEEIIGLIDRLEELKDPARLSKVLTSP